MHIAPNSRYHIVQGDSREVLKNWQEPVDLIITSPPYADARKKCYESAAPDAYAEWLASFHSVFWQALTPEGNLVLNLKDKVVEGVRHRYVWHSIETLSALGWYCIDDFLWHKKTAMPGYWPNRLRDAFEYCFHLAKCKRPYMNQEAVKIPIAASTAVRSRRLSLKDQHPQLSATGSGLKRHPAYWQHKTHVLPTNVLHLSPETRNQGHPAVFPVALPRFFIQLFCPPEGLVCDPFAGSGTTGVAALELGRRVLLIDQSPAYAERMKERLARHVRPSLSP
jgi:site-specific DNA-methyltransferase (adenine-specific)